MEVQRVDLAHGVARAAADGDSQKRACGGDGVTRGLLAEVLQRRQRARALLRFVEDDESLALFDRFSRFELESRDEPLYVVAQLELLMHRRVLVEVDVGDVREMGPSELFQKPCLSDLTRTVQNQGLAPRPVLPFDKPVHQKSFHWAS